MPSSGEYCGKVCPFTNTLPPTPDEQIIEDNIVRSFAVTLYMEDETHITSVIRRQGLSPGRILAAHGCAKQVVAGECSEFTFVPDAHVVRRSQLEQN